MVLERLTMDCNSVNVKKKQKSGRLTDVMKKMRTASHEIGDDCNCVRYKCYQTVPLAERLRIISQFNEMVDYDTQNKYLSGLISVLPVAQRRNSMNNLPCREASYAYRVRVFIDGNLQDVQVCHTGFLSIHGITKKRVETIRKQLRVHGEVQPDNRGKHGNRPFKLSEDTNLKMRSFIESLKGRKSHYSLKDTIKTYLPEELNQTKLHKMYNDANIHNQVGLSTFTQFFNSNFNISFGYPRKDTCSTCDLLRAEIAAIEKKMNEPGDHAVDEQTKMAVSKALQEKEDERTLHLAAGGKFYDLKRDFKKESKKRADIVSITMDYEKNLPTPNITTSDVYYRRQLNFISFNIHILKDSTSIFYTYDESVAKKGADEVCSMLNNFIFNELSSDVRQLVIFCDSCAGQNKNYTVIRYLYYVVHEKNRLESVEVIFPIRGHSYMESDKDMALVNGKAYTETPEDWRDVLRNSRVHPSPFKVINCGIEVQFETWTQFLSKKYIAKCPVPTRPIRRLLISKNKPKIMYKNTYSGYYFDFDIVKRVRREIPLEVLYNEPVPIKRAKHKDLLFLSTFLMESSQDFYKKLKSSGGTNNDDDDDIEYCDDVLIDQ